MKWAVGGFCGCGGSAWVMGEWAVGHWIVGVTSFRKIFGLYSVEHHKVDKWSCRVGSGWVWWVWWVCALSVPDYLSITITSIQNPTSAHPMRFAESVCKGEGVP